MHSVKPKTLQKIQETREKSDALCYLSITFSSTLVQFSLIFLWSIEITFYICTTSKYLFIHWKSYTILFDGIFIWLLVKIKETHVLLSEPYIYTKCKSFAREHECFSLNREKLFANVSFLFGGFCVYSHVSRLFSSFLITTKMISMGFRTYWL